MERIKGRLREQLKEASPELYASLMRSWEIAEREWLPAMPNRGGSFNSAPHIKNVEYYADVIMAQVDGKDAPFGQLSLSPAEKYVLLAAILFHDIGRIKDNDAHGTKSKETVAESYAKLGIEDEHLAEAIGRICEYHDPEDPKSFDLPEVHVSPYGTIRVEQLAILLALFDELDGAHSRVYPNYVSEDLSILSGFRRSTSDIRAEVSDMTIITCVDIKRHTVDEKERDNQLLAKCKRECKVYSKCKKTPDRQNPKKDDPSCEYCEIMKKTNKIYTQPITFKHKNIYLYFDKKFWNRYYGCYGEHLPVKSKKKKDDIFKLLDGENTKQIETFCTRITEALKSRYWEVSGRKPDSEVEIKKEVGSSQKFGNWFKKGIGNFRNLFLHKDGDKDKVLLPFTTLEHEDSFLPKIPKDKDIVNSWEMLPYYILSGNGHCKFKEGSGKKNPNINKNLVFFTTLAAYVRNAAKKLEKLEADLSRFGIPFRAWVLEYEDHLFTWYGRETYEASLTQGFLLEMAHRMWQLSAAIFGREPYSYETLAAKLRAKDIQQVKTAVRRIAIVMRHRHKDDMVGHVIRYSDSVWWWELHNENEGEDVRRLHSYQDVCNQIKKLEDPCSVKDPFATSSCP